MLRARKIIAQVLAFAFLFTNVAFAHKPTENLWDQRKKSYQVASVPAGMQPFLNNGANQSLRQSLLDATPAIQSALNSGNKGSSLVVTRLDPLFKSPLVANLPGSFFTHVNLREVHNAASKTPIILIEDVHQNLEAQTHISQALQSLGSVSGKTPITVALEGASGAFRYDIFRKFPNQQIVQEVADSYLNSGDIGGPAHAGFGFTPAAGSKGLQFVGVDDPLAYRANVAAYKDTKTLKASTQNKIQDLKKKLDAEKKSNFSRKMLAFDSAVESYRSGAMPMPAFVKILAASGVETSFTVETFLNAFQMEKSISFDQVEKERAVVIEKIVKTAGDKQIQDLVSLSLGYQEGSLTFGDYYSNLRNMCRKNGIDLSQTPHFDNYIRYVLLADGIRADELYDDLNAMEAKVYESLATTQKQKALVADAKQLYLAGELVNFSLTSNQWQEYRGFAGLDLKPFEQFYISAEIRSHKMVQNLNGANVLVAGGYHTLGLTELFKAKKLSYVVVTPKITKVDEGSASAYLSVFDREKTPLENIFAGKKLFMVKPVDGPGQPPINPGSPNATAQIAHDDVAIQAATTGLGPDTNQAERAAALAGDPERVTGVVPDGNAKVVTSVVNGNTLRSLVTDLDTRVRSSILWAIKSMHVTALHAVTTFTSRWDQFLDWFKRNHRPVAVAFVGVTTVVLINIVLSHYLPASTGTKTAATPLTPIALAAFLTWLNGNPPAKSFQAPGDELVFAVQLDEVVTTATPEFFGSIHNALQKSVGDIDHYQILVQQDVLFIMVKKSASPNADPKGAVERAVRSGIVSAVADEAATDIAKQFLKSPSSEYSFTLEVDRPRSTMSAMTVPNLDHLNHSPLGVGTHSPTSAAKPAEPARLQQKESLPAHFDIDQAAQQVRNALKSVPGIRLVKQAIKYFFIGTGVEFDEDDEIPVSVMGKAKEIRGDRSKPLTAEMARQILEVFNSYPLRMNLLWRIFSGAEAYRRSLEIMKGRTSSAAAAAGVYLSRENIMALQPIWMAFPPNAAMRFASNQTFWQGAEEWVFVHAIYEALPNEDDKRLRNHLLYLLTEIIAPPQGEVESAAIESHAPSEKPNSGGRAQSGDYMWQGDPRALTEGERVPSAKHDLVPVENSVTPVVARGSKLPYASADGDSGKAATSDVEWRVSILNLTKVIHDKAQAVIRLDADVHDRVIRRYLRRLLPDLETLISKLETKSHSPEMGRVLLPIITSLHAETEDVRKFVHQDPSGFFVQMDEVIDLCQKIQILLASGVASAEWDSGKPAASQAAASTEADAKVSARIELERALAELKTLILNSPQAMIQAIASNQEGGMKHAADHIGGVAQAFNVAEDAYYALIKLFFGKRSAEPPATRTNAPSSADTDPSFSDATVLEIRDDSDVQAGRHFTAAGYMGKDDPPFGSRDTALGRRDDISMSLFILERCLRDMIGAPQMTDAIALEIAEELQAITGPALEEAGFSYEAEQARYLALAWTALAQPSTEDTILVKALERFSPKELKDLTDDLISTVRRGLSSSSATTEIKADIGGSIGSHTAPGGYTAKDDAPPAGGSMLDEFRDIAISFSEQGSKEESKSPAPTTNAVTPEKNPIHRGFMAPEGQHPDFVTHTIVHYEIGNLFRFEQNQVPDYLVDAIRYVTDKAVAEGKFREAIVLDFHGRQIRIIAVHSFGENNIDVHGLLFNAVRSGLAVAQDEGLLKDGVDLDDAQQLEKDLVIVTDESSFKERKGESVVYAFGIDLAVGAVNKMIMDYLFKLGSGPEQKLGLKRFPGARVRVRRLEDVMNGKEDADEWEIETSVDQYELFTENDPEVKADKKKLGKRKPGPDGMWIKTRTGRNEGIWGLAIGSQSNEYVITAAYPIEGGSLPSTEPLVTVVYKPTVATDGRRLLDPTVKLRSQGGPPAVGGLQDYVMEPKFSPGGKGGKYFVVNAPKTIDEARQKPRFDEGLGYWAMIGWQSEKGETNKPGGISPDGFKDIVKRNPPNFETPRQEAIKLAKPMVAHGDAQPHLAPWAAEERAEHIRHEQDALFKDVPNETDRDPMLAPLQERIKAEGWVRVDDNKADVGGDLGHQGVPIYMVAVYQATIQEAKEQGIPGLIEPGIITDGSTYGLLNDMIRLGRNDNRGVGDDGHMIILGDNDVNAKVAKQLAFLAFTRAIHFAMATGRNPYGLGQDYIGPEAKAAMAEPIKHSYYSPRYFELLARVLPSEFISKGDVSIVETVWSDWKSGKEEKDQIPASAFTGNVTAQGIGSAGYAFDPKKENKFGILAGDKMGPPAFNLLMQEAVFEAAISGKFPHGLVYGIWDLKAFPPGITPENATPEQLKHIPTKRIFLDAVKDREAVKRYLAHSDRYNVRDVWVKSKDGWDINNPTDYLDRPLASSSVTRLGLLTGGDYVGKDDPIIVANAVLFSFLTDWLRRNPLIVQGDMFGSHNAQAVPTKLDDAVATIRSHPILTAIEYTVSNDGKNLINVQDVFSDRAFEDRRADAHKWNAEFHRAQGSQHEPEGVNVKLVEPSYGLKEMLDAMNDPANPFLMKNRVKWDTDRSFPVPASVYMPDVYAAITGRSIILNSHWIAMLFGGAIFKVVAGLTLTQLIIVGAVGVVLWISLLLLVKLIVSLIQQVIISSRARPIAAEHSAAFDRLVHPAIPRDGKVELFLAAAPKGSVFYGIDATKLRNAAAVGAYLDRAASLPKNERLAAWVCLHLFLAESKKRGGNLSLTQAVELGLKKSTKAELVVANVVTPEAIQSVLAETEALSKRNLEKPVTIILAGLGFDTDALISFQESVKGFAKPNFEIRVQQVTDDMRDADGMYWFDADDTNEENRPVSLLEKAAMKIRDENSAVSRLARKEYSDVDFLAITNGAQFLASSRLARIMNLLIRVGDEYQFVPASTAVDAIKQGMIMT